MSKCIVSVRREGRKEKGMFLCQGEIGGGVGLRDGSFMEDKIKIEKERERNGSKSKGNS